MEKITYEELFNYLDKNREIYQKGNPYLYIDHEYLEIMVKYDIFQKILKKSDPFFKFKYKNSYYIFIFFVRIVGIRLENVYAENLACFLITENDIFYKEIAETKNFFLKQNLNFKVSVMENILNLQIDDPHFNFNKIILGNCILNKNDIKNRTNKIMIYLPDIIEEFFPNIGKNVDLFKNFNKNYKIDVKFLLKN